MNSKEIKTITEIRNKYQRHNFYSGYLIDHFIALLSPYFTKIFLKYRIVPNQVTLLMIIFGIIGAIFFMFDAYFFKLLGIVFMYLWYIMDFSDGEVARVTKKFSKFGQEFDYTAHVINHPLFALSFYLSIPSSYLDFRLLIIILGFVDTIYRSLAIFGIIRDIKLNASNTDENIIVSNSIQKFIKHIFLSIGSFPSFALTFSIFLIFDINISYYYLIIVLMISILVTIKLLYDWIKLLLISK